MSEENTPPELTPGPPEVPETPSTPADDPYAKPPSDPAKQEKDWAMFTHLSGLCRAIGIPARYVSGYFFDATRDNSMRGSEASHAWVEVFIDGVGWIGLDPTNNKVTDETYIILARGRDYRDVAPVTGVYNGIGRSGMQVHVSVERLSDSEHTDDSVPTD